MRPWQFSFLTRRLVYLHLTITAGFMAIWTKASDIIGRKQTTIAALVILLAFSIGCGCAQTVNQLYELMVLDASFSESDFAELGSYFEHFRELEVPADTHLPFYAYTKLLQKQSFRPTAPSCHVVLL
jgi:hypothetical protein